MISTNGVSKLGGDDFDEELIKLVFSKYKDLTGDDLEKEDFTKTDAEEEKKSLSKRDKVVIRVNKKIIEGANQVAGDWGHQPIPYPTKEEALFETKCRIDTCGRPLCAEQFLSGTGFENNFNKKNNTNLKAPDIVQLDFKNDERAKIELNLYEDRLARVISVMIGIFDPDAIVLGGGMSNIDRLYSNIPKILPRYTFSDKVRNKILRNKHGDSSGVRGAAWLWND